jgi:hypothetical protein
VDNNFEKFNKGDKVLFMGETYILMNYSYAKISKVHWWAVVKNSSGKQLFLPAYELTKIDLNNSKIKETPRIRWYNKGKLT